MNILGKAKISVEQAENWARNRQASDLFISLAKIYWELAPERGRVNPEVAYAQAAWETGNGKFTGVVSASYHNPCGLKTGMGGDNYSIKAHTKFPDWKTGITAHLDHLALYAGAKCYPKKESPDPRHFGILYGTAKRVVDLGGKWAPSSAYGYELESLIKRMRTLNNYPKFRFVSRQRWGADPAKNKFPISGKVEGIFVHYTSSLSDEQTAHKNCAKRVKGIQSFHMGPQRGWADIAYSWIICKHGYIFEGRGWDVVGAHTQGYNHNNHAVCFLGGDDVNKDDVTDKGRKALAIVILESFRRGYGRKVRGHGEVNPTDCPGKELQRWVNNKKYVGYYA